MKHGAKMEFSISMRRVSSFEFFVKLQLLCLVAQVGDKHNRGSDKFITWNLDRLDLKIT